MLSWPRAERKASRLVKDLDIEDLHDQLDSLRAYVNELSQSAGTRRADSSAARDISHRTPRMMPRTS